jgi:hypothetical protein
MVKKSFLQRNEKLLSLTLLAAVILVWLAVFLFEIPLEIPQQQSTHPGLSQSFEGCHIEYGHSKCMDGSMVTSFYNPGSEELTRVSMHFYDGEDVDIYNCREPLEPGIPATLTTLPCTSDMDTSDIILEWCCGEECHNTTMSNPSTDLSLVYKF